jgi:uncharacterized protein (DUF58 family)
VRRTYLENFKQHEEQLKQACRAIKADLVTCPIDQPLLDAVMAVVRRRGA